MKNHYILMGDIVGSSTKNGDDLMQHFKSVIEEVNSQYKDNIVSPLTITLGDEFQGIVKDLQATIDILFHIDQKILSSDLYYNMRYVINYGPIDTPLNGQIAYEMLGSGLTEARTRLNEQKRNNVKIHVSGLDDGVLLKLNKAFKLYQSLHDDIKEKDRKLAYDFLNGADYKALAIKFDRDDSSMWRKKQSLKIEDLLTACSLIKAIADE